ncbi:DUF2163 domain-containing protein [Roseovarius sp. 2305UL8-3]|uniref:DUF2163 domain-containing protein n=1 Tax=Roseovarius conchicola TaxID=3121636 RepID=UPI003528367E
MSDLNPELLAHLKGSLTTLCRCWDITRADGTVMGFTDHDGPLAFDEITYRADTGLSAMALQQTTGLSVDNTEALGALRDSAISEEDIEAGRYDGAKIRAWLVNWADVRQRQLLFRGTIGEMRRFDEGFEAELRGLTQPLNLPLGRAYQKPCAAVLGDGQCRFDLDLEGYSETLPAVSIEERRVFQFDALGSFDAEWFRHGRLIVQDGAAGGLSGVIKRDRLEDGRRVIELWHPLRADVQPGDLLRIEAGCDKRFATCKDKFDNLLNYQGFPDLPGDDWSVRDPTRAGSLSGGSRRS